MGASWIQDPVLGRRIMYFAVAFAYSCKQRLRDEPLRPEDLSDTVHPGEVCLLLCCKLHLRKFCLVPRPGIYW